MTFIMNEINIRHIGEAMQKDEVPTSNSMTNINPFYDSV